MNELVSIRLTGHVAAFPATREASDALRQYLDDARRELRSDPDADEIVRDLESAIGDRLSSRTSSDEDAAPDSGQGPAPDSGQGSVIGLVTGAEMAAILAGIGPVNPALPSSPSSPPSPPSPSSAAGRPRGRFWCRINEGKWFGGICLGISAYGEFRVDWVRTVVLLLTLFTGGLLALPYLALLLVLPVVATVADYERQRDASRFS